MILISINLLISYFTGAGWVAMHCQD